MSVDESLMCSFQILKSSKKKKWLNKFYSYLDTPFIFENRILPKDEINLPFLEWIVINWLIKWIITNLKIDKLKEWR